VTLAHYEQHIDEFRGGTRDHDVSQNIAWLFDNCRRAAAAEPVQQNPHRGVLRKKSR